MPTVSLDNLTLSMLIILTVAIYVVIMVVFLIARKKYRGGVVDRVIRYIIATLGLRNALRMVPVLPVDQMEMEGPGTVMAGHLMSLMIGDPMIDVVHQVQ